MKIILTLFFVTIALAATAQSADTTQTKKTEVVKQDSLPQPAAERVYKVNMIDYQHDTNKVAPPNFMEPYKVKKLESNYQFEDGKVRGGSTELKLGKKKKNE